MGNQIEPIDELRKNLYKMGEQFKAVLPDHVTPKKFIRVVVTAIQQDQKLLAATRHSLFNACMKSAQDGLIPDGREAALVVFNKNIGTKESPRYEKQVQYMPMVAGILKKVRNSGELLSITAQIVFENDQFEYWIDEHGPHLKHQPELMGDPGEPRLAYAVANTKSGGIYTELMNKSQIEHVRDSSKAKNSGPWKNWPGEMWKKTVIRRLSKKLPMSTDLENTIHADDELTQLDDPTPEAPRIENKKPARLGKLIEEQTKEEAPPHPRDEEKIEQMPVGGTKEEQLPI